MSQGSSSSSERKEERFRVKKPIQLVLDEVQVLKGITWDVSQHGFSAFLQLYDRDAPKAQSYNMAIDVDQVQEHLLNKSAIASFLEGDSDVPRNVKVVRVERSWEPQYDVFVGVTYEGVVVDEAHDLNRNIAQELSELKQLSHDQDLEIIQNLSSTTPDVITMVYPARMSYAKYVREMAEDLATLMGFDDPSIFQIKLVTDEVFTNAFEHGSPRYGESRIRVTFYMDSETFFVRIRDQGGIKLNQKAIIDKIEHHQGPKTGFALVNSFMDGWSIETDEGKHTTVSFYKTKPGKEA